MASDMLSCRCWAIRCTAITALKKIRVLLMCPRLEAEANNDIRNLVVSQPSDLLTPDAKEGHGSGSELSKPKVGAPEKNKTKRKAEDAKELPASAVKPRRLGFGSAQKERHDALTDEALGDSSSENPGEEEAARAVTSRGALDDIGEEDADLFKDKYALAVPETPAGKCKASLPAIMDAPAPAASSGSWDKLPRAIRSKLEKVESDLIEFLPTTLSQYPAGIDETCDILNLSDALEFVSELGGNWLDSLGEKSKTIQAKLTLKGKKALSSWPEELKAAQQDADNSEAQEAEWMDTWLARKVRELGENTTVVNQLTQAWLVDLQTHIVRPTDYKGRLLVSGHEVNLEAWAATMDFLGITQRWQKTKLFTPATQLASDFLYRHSHNPATHKCNIYGQDLSHQRFRSLELIVDASPKGKLDVWSPIGYAGRVAAALPLQRLSALAVSTVSVQTKMEEGQKIVDKFAETAAEGKQAKLKKMHLGSIKIRPKAISKIRQKKLSAREQMRACMHVLSVLDLELLVGTDVLRPLDPVRGEKRIMEDGNAWLWDPATGEASWDCLTPRHQSHLRLVVAPDEGSTLWAAFTFLASQNFKVNFVRDELSPHKLQNHYLRLFQCNKAVKRTWALSEWLMKAKRGPWAHSEDLLQELFASSILEENGWDANAEGIHAFENVCEEGVNPFADMGMAATGNDGQKYNRIMDCCIRALIDEEAHKLFESLQFFTEPWCEMCLWLATGLHMQEGLGPQGAAFATTESDLDMVGVVKAASPHGGTELRVVKRRCRVQQDLLRDHLDVCLVTLYELGSYQLYLTAAPACSSCLLLKESTEVPDLEAVQAKVLQALEFEWATVLSMEQNKNTADLLHKLCPHVRWQVYRETMVGLETDAFKVTQTVRDLVMAWYPRLSFSANIEDQFAAMQDSVRRGSKGGAAGITNLNTVGVKALYAKML
ncbi:unnamed protein product, partial [Symbiodinium sp. KB8]